MIKAIFTDLDGVIRHWENQNLFNLEESHNLPKGFLFQVAFAKKHLIPVITGAIKHEQWLQRIQKELQAKTTANIANQLIAAWVNAEFSIDQTLIFKLRNSIPSGKLVLVTNATDRLERDLKDCSINEYFDVVINSSEIFSAKPEKDFYFKALELTGVVPSEAIFIDDSINNIREALNIGFETILFDDREKALRKVVELTHFDSDQLEVAVASTS